METEGFDSRERPTFLLKIHAKTFITNSYSGIMETITVFFVFTFAFVIGVVGGWIDRGRWEKKKQKKDLEAAFNAGRTTSELDMAFFQEMGWKLKYLTFDEYLESKKSQAVVVK